LTIALGKLSWKHIGGIGIGLIGMVLSLAGQTMSSEPDGFNLVANSGFEWVNTDLSSFTGEGSHFSEAVPKWQTPNRGSTDLIGPAFKGRPGRSTEVVRSGSYSVGLSINTTRWGEYISAPLLIPLQPNQWYYAEAWVRVGVSVRFGDQPQPLNPFFGFFFGDQTQEESTWMLEANPQVAGDSIQTVSSYSWNPVRGFFQVEQPASWLTFGQFVGPGPAPYILSGYFYVDDLKVVEANPFPTEWQDLGVHALQHVYFEFDAADLTPESQPQLLQLVRFLTLNPSLSCRVIGFTDAVGTEAYNLQLSQLRAQAVADFLMARGIAADRLLVEGRGEALEALEAGQARRVIFETYPTLEKNR
jgi:outer membrane protein OmpA-like peptidoglycan-associated protein